MGVHRTRPGNRELLFVSYHFPPFRSSGMARIRNFMECLPGAGWDPVFLVPEPGAYPEAYLDESLLRDVPEGLAVYRTPLRRPLEIAAGLRDRLRGRERSPPARTGPPPGPRGANGDPRPRGAWQGVKDVVGDLLSVPDRHVGWIPGALAGSGWIFRRHRIPLVVSSGPPWTTHLVARLLARRYRLAWVADFRDPWVGNPFMELGQSPLRRRANRWLERGSLEAADLVVANTAELAEELRARYPALPRDRFHVMTNGMSPRERAEVRSWPRRRPGGPLTLVHTGTLYGDRSPRALIEALDLLLREDPGLDVRLELVGRLGDPELVRGPLRDCGAAARIVSCRGVVPREEALRIQHAADVLVLIQPDAPLQVPGKLFEYLLFERPILALAGSGATRNLLRGTSLARVVGLGDREGIAAAIRQLVEEKRGGALAASFDPAEADRFDFGRLCCELGRRIDGLVPAR